MSASPQKPLSSNVTCRYWATSGTCFFGDQCNFAHNPVDRAASGRSGFVAQRFLLRKPDHFRTLLGYLQHVTVPKREKACKELLLTGYCKNEKTGCEYNHEIRNMTRAGPPASQTASATSVPTTSIVFSSRPSTTSTSLNPGTAAAIRNNNNNNNRLPVSAPAFVPAAVAAAQRASLSAWGGVTPGSTKPVDGGSSTQATLTTTTTSTSSIVSVSIQNDNMCSRDPVSLLNAQPFVPSNGQGASVGTANAAPFVPSSRPPGGRGDESFMAFGGPAQQQQQQQQQLQQIKQHEAEGQAQAMKIIKYMGMEVPMVGLPSFRLPDGDDPALGMTAMSPPNPAFLARVGGSGSLSVLPAPDVMASVRMVRDDGTGVLQVDSSFFSHNYGGGLPSPSSVRAQLHQHMQSMQLQQQQHAFSGQSSPFSSHLPQRTGGLTPDKQLSSQSELSQSLEAQATPEKTPLSNDNKQVQEHVLLSPERREPDQLSTMQPLESQQQQQPVQIQSPQQQSTLKQQHYQQQQLQQQQQQQQAQIQQQIQLQALHQHQQMRHRIRQQQQQQQQPQHFQQQHAQGQRIVSGNGFSQQRLPSMRSASPVSGVSPVAAATHGGATYFLGPGQGISSLSHAFNAPGSRNESRTGRSQQQQQQLAAGTVLLGSRFLPDQLREELRHRHSLIHAQLDPEQELVDLPEMVQRFHSLFPLEDANREDEIPHTSLGVRTMIFKGISSSDGQAYAIRQIDSRQVIPTAELAATAVEAVERWAPFARHPHVVAIRESFVSREVEDTAALFFVHDYYPGACTLQTLHLQQEQAGGVVHLTVNEEQLWSYMVQLATVLRAVHGAGLYFRPGGLHPSKVVLTSKGRIRVSGVGILDVLHGDPADDPRIFQREDLAGCGRLILALACGSTANASLEFMGSHYSTDLVRVTQALLASSPEKSDGGGISSIRQLYSILADRMFSEIENVHMQNDELMNELSKEMENGRLLRILVKLGMMNERPENDMDPGWSETGDRYLLKLFRDFVFHQTSEEGTPVIDWGHVIECLNKLDAGVPENIILLSRDERSMLIASYADLKRCLETVYQELLVRASGDKGRQVLLQTMLMQSQARLIQRQHIAT